jgi:hypothetical protein
MPVVQIKDSDQKIKFPDQMSQDQILNALKRQYPMPVSQKIDDALSKPESTISNRDTSLAENTKQKIANFLFDNKIVSDRYGAQRIGDNLSSLLGVLPGIGDAQAGDEFGKAVAEGDGLGIGMGALAALPIVGDVAAKGVRAVTSNFNPKLIDTKEGFKIQTDNGKLDGLSLGDDFMVKISKVEENSRGKGEGIELYINAMEEARKKGFKRLVSDNETVDEPAIRIYEALERRGYKVDKHPDFKLVTHLKGSNFAYAGDNSAFSIDLSTIPEATK